jgi:hypothetical protein
VNFIKEEGDLRVRIEQDEYAEEPYSEGGPAIVRIENRWWTRAEPVSNGPEDGVEIINNAIKRWGTPSDSKWPLVEKYLRAYYGTKHIETYNSGEYWYILFDTAEWRATASKDPDWTIPDNADYLGEWKSWVNGEVYSYFIERKATWRRVDPVTDDQDYLDTMTTWEIADSCGGFYGYDVAEEAALESYASYTEES